MVLRRISPMSCAKMLGVLDAAIGLILGLFFSLISLVFGSMMGGDGGTFGALFGVGAVILLPIFYGIIGFIGGGLVAWVYNIVAMYVGGIEMDFDMGPSNPVPPVM